MVENHKNLCRFFYLDTAFILTSKMEIVLLVKTVRINLTSRIPRKRMVRTYIISRENSNRQKSFRMHVISSCMLSGAWKRIKDEWKSFSSCLCKKPPVMAPIYYSRIWNSEEMSRKMFKSILVRTEKRV